MKKETIIAISLGVLLGLIVAGVFIYQTQAKNTTKHKQDPTTAPKPTPQQENQILILSDPEREAIVNISSVMLKGKARKNSLLVIMSPFDTIIKQVQTENFEINFPLKEGENLIRLSMYPQGSQTNVQEKFIKVYYLPDL